MSRARGQLVAIGASWGGLHALRTILHALPGELDSAVVIAQHRAPESRPNGLRDSLREVASLQVTEAADKEELAAGTVYLAPTDYHLLVDGDVLALTTDVPVLYARPSIDVLFETAAESYRERCVGVVLTGANDDGAHGLARIVELGGRAIVQDPSTAERDVMPKAALAAVPAAQVAPLEQIAGLVLQLCGVKAAA